MGVGFLGKCDSDSGPGVVENNRPVTIFLMKIVKIVKRGRQRKC